MSTYKSIWKLIVLAVLLGGPVLACGTGGNPTASLGKPTVTITYPADGSQVVVGQVTSIQASGTDAQGVTRVEIKVDGALAGTTPSPNAQGQTALAAVQSWTFTQAGNHVITAQAFNAVGQSSDVAVVNVQAVESAGLQSTPGTGPAQATVAPEATPAEIPGPGGCTFNASYVADVTVPDDTPFSPNTAFVKTWRVRNSGTCDWETGTKLVYASGDPLGGPPSVDVPPVAAGSTTDVSVSFAAPGSPGTYRSTWQMQKADGVRFGSQFYVQIVVSGQQAPALSAGMEPDTDRPGMDYKDFALSSPDPELCRSACSGEAQCQAYTYVKPASQGEAAHCWLKSGVPPAFPNTCCVSGAKSVTPTSPPSSSAATFNDYPSAVAYLEGGQPRIYAFSKGNDGRLYVNHWNGAKWQWADQGTPSGTNAGNLGQVIAYLEGTSPRIYAFTASGSHLYVHYWNGSKWQWADQGAATPDAIAGPGVITYREGGTQRIYAFVRGADSRLRVNYWNGAKWQWADQGTPTSAGVAAGPGVITYQEGGTQRIYAFVRGSDGHLHVNYWNGAKWQWADQGTPTNASVNSAPGVIAYLEGTSPRIYAFVRGSDGHLHMNYWNGTKWQWADQGVPKAGVNVSANPAAVTLQTGNVHNIDVFVRGSDNRLYRHYRTFAGEWRWEDMGTPQNATVLSVPSVTTYKETDLQRIHAFVIGSDHHLHVLYGDGGGHWQWADQGTP